jgi:hypothetical protein
MQKIDYTLLSTLVYESFIFLLFGFHKFIVLGGLVT